LLGRDWMGRENIRNWGEFRRGEIGRDEKGWRQTRWEKIVSIHEKWENELGREKVRWRKVDDKTRGKRWE
jgi:hypothetical protein